MHWIADATGCEPSRLTTENLSRALVELPDRLELTRVGEPQVIEHRDGQGGRSLAGIVLIAESHVSAHCFPDEKSVHVDVFSCKAMNLDVARRYVAEYFRAESLTEKVLQRGLVPDAVDQFDGPIVPTPAAG